MYETSGTDPEPDHEPEPEPEEGDEPTADEVADDVESALDEAADVAFALQQERDALRDDVLRARADFDNYRKRAHRETAEAGDRALGRFVEELLPVLDALDSARAHGASEGTGDAVLGLLVDLLAKQGLERLDAQDDVFDPTRHDAVVHEEADDGDDVQVVAEVLRAGWIWRGRVLRPAMVKVRG